MSFIQFQKYKLFRISQDGHDYIFENQEEKDKYAYDYFISVLF
jgi:hypothetical protein